jgi:mannitol 2-dehydrogenase
MQLGGTPTTSLPAGVARPGYDRARLRTGIVHFGVGGFHRAHQAAYLDELMNQGDALDWGICGVGVMPADRRMRDALAEQHGLYTLVVKHPDGRREARVVGSIVDHRHAPDDPEAAIERMAAPATRIVSLTITEGGYNFDFVAGRFNLHNPEILSDLRGQTAPRTVFGLVTEALRRRWARGIAPFTIMSCDNMQGSGGVARAAFTTFASEIERGLGRWVDEQVAFPNAMVDRITPVTTAEDVAELADGFGIEDRCPVVCEPFRQWVIAGDFAAGRPAWERSGAQFVTDVAPFEAMKLRLLNASHSMLAYLGFLAGYETIWQVAAQPDFAALMRELMEEATPTLALPADVDLPAYKATLVERFGNPALPHRTQQIAMDGAQKLPQRLLGTVCDNLAAGRPIDRAALAVAGWMRYASGVDEAGREIRISDPLAADFARVAAANGGDPQALARGLLGLTAIFGTDLPVDPRFVGPVTRWLASLFADGAASTVARAARGRTPKPE